MWIYILVCQFILFQPTPVPKGQRYNAFTVSFLASVQFQSSPVPKGQRYSTLLRLTGNRFKFQSSPVPEGQRNTETEPLTGCMASFNPRQPQGSAQRAVALRLFHRCFNPRQPFGASAPGQKFPSSGYSFNPRLPDDENRIIYRRRSFHPCQYSSLLLSLISSILLPCITKKSL